MKRMMLALVLVGCADDVVCGPGTERIDGVCVPVAPPAVEVPPMPPLPTAAERVAPEEAPRPSDIALRVVVAADGSITMDGVPVDDAGFDERARAYGTLHPNDGSALIDAHPDAPHATTVTLLDRLNAAGVTHVAFRLATPDPE